MSLAQKALAALASAILLSCTLLFLLIGPSAHFHQVSLTKELEHQEIQEILRNGWHVFYHEEWETIECFMEDPTASLEVALPIQDVYLMKMKIRLGEVGQRMEVWVNGTYIGHLVAKKARQAERFRFNIPVGVAREGPNLITFQKAPRSPSVAVEKITFANFQLGDKTSLVLLWRTSPQFFVPWPKWSSVLTLWSACATVECTIIWWLSRSMVLPIQILVLFDLLSYLPLFVCMSTLFMVSLVSPYRLVVNTSWFLVRLCVWFIALPKLYLLGFVSRRYVELVQQVASHQRARWSSARHVDYANVWRVNQSLVVSLGVIATFIVFDARQRGQRIRRRIRWVSRLRAGNWSLVWFLGLWGLAAVPLFLTGTTGVSEWIANIAVPFLAAAVIRKGYGALRHAHAYG